MVEGNKTDTEPRVSKEDMNAAKEAGTAPGAPSGAPSGAPPSPPTAFRVPTIPIIIEYNKTGYRAPASTHVGRGSGVEFINRTDGDVSIQFASGRLFGLSNTRIPAEKSRILFVQKGALAKDYAFSAYCHASDVFAEGNSMPIIIVDSDT